MRFPIRRPQPGFLGSGVPGSSLKFMEIQKMPRAVEVTGTPKTTLNTQPINP